MSIVVNLTLLRHGKLYLISKTYNILAATLDNANRSYYNAFLAIKQPGMYAQVLMCSSVYSYLPMYNLIKLIRYIFFDIFLGTDTWH